jgi:hypothetical protein
LCHGGGTIAAAVINDNHLVDELTGDRLDHTANSSLFIERWDNRHNAHGVSFQSARHDGATRLLHPASKKPANACFACRGVCEPLGQEQV